MKKILFLLFLTLSSSLYAQITAGTSRVTVMTDQSGNVLNTPLTFTNQVQSLVTATAQYQIITYSTFTNSIFAITNNAILNSITNIASVGAGTGLTYQVQNKVGQFVSLIPKGGLSITNQGGTNLILTVTSSSGGGGFLTTNTVNTVTSGAFGILGNWTNNGVLTVSGNLNAHSDIILTNSGDSGVIYLQAIKYSDASSSMDVLLDNLSGVIKLKQNGSTVFSAPGGIWKDAGNTTAFDSDGRTISDGAGGKSFDAKNRYLDNTYTNRGSFDVRTNLTVGGTINGLSSSTFITNVTASGATITGQGTAVINVAVPSGVQTNATTVWTAPFITTGLSNVFGSFSAGATNIVNGFLGINTNGVVNVNYPLVITPNTGAGAVVSKMRMESSSSAGYDAGNASRGWQLICDGIGDVYDQTYGTIGTRYWYRNGAQIMNFDGTTLTIGQTVSLGSGSSSTLTLNGATLSIPNNLNVNSGGQWWPTSLTSIATNGWATNYFSGEMQVLKGITVSNMVSQTTTGTGTVNFGTNLVANIIATSNLSTQALMSFRTNTLTAALPVINTIYTNNNTRLYCNIAVKLPCTISASSSCALWQQTGTFTNYQGIVSSEDGVAGTITNNCTGMINPGALYMITNLDVAGGTPALIPPHWNETRY